MKNFWINFIVAVIFILPNVAQADTLDDFKNILASKHFFIKYTYQIDGNYYNTNNTGVLIKDKDGAQIMNGANFNAPHIAIEAYDNNNFYTEEGAQPPVNLPETQRAKIINDERSSAICHLKIGDKNFGFRKSRLKGKVRYNYNLKWVYYHEVDEDFDFLKTKKVELPIGTVDVYEYNTALSQAVIALFNKEDDPYSGKFLYNRAGNGTTEDGLEYFDLKADTRNSNYLNAIRYTFEDGVIKKIDMALYAKAPNTGEISGYKLIINVEEFNTNPAPNYFQLPKNFKKFEKIPEGVKIRY